MHPAMAAMTSPAAARPRFNVAIGFVLLAAAVWAAPARAGQQALAPERLPALVDYATSKKSFQVTPRTATKYFGKLAPLTATKRDDTWRFVGQDTATGVLWAVVDFQQGERQGDWELREAEFALTPAMTTGGITFLGLCKEIGKRLRLPKLACQNNDEKRVGWTVGPGRVGSLQDGEFENPITQQRTRSTTVKLLILQGEAD